MLQLLRSGVHRSGNDKTLGSDKIVNNSMKLVMGTKEIQMVGVAGLGKCVGNEDDTVTHMVDLGKGPGHVIVGAFDLVGDACRSKEVLYGIGLETFDLDEPLFDEFLDEKIYRPKGHSNLLGKFPLRCFRVLVDVVEEG